MMGNRSLWPSNGSLGWPARPTTPGSAGRAADGHAITWGPATWPASTPSQGGDEAALRVAVAEINQALDDQITADTTPEQARALIAAEVRAWIAEQAGSGRYQLTAQLEAQLTGAVYNERFGLGALQPLLEDPDIETIDVNGADQVWINYADGRKEQGEPVADSDAQLVELIRRWGAYQGQTARDFSPAKPKLRLALADG